ncbi:thioesterase [Kitasatospora xanthocidica]|uniref:thioesterase II family protein n=1 Tax=Kitasatospora xanthocidica TaxID=83382 RepID=UPI0016725856|nr:alpha/beta fold hydrolase [Kitasatospora xanthocidica]GHF37071.1 thioesterase [Kitasatospora xanthocidica]
MSRPNQDGAARWLPWTKGTTGLPRVYCLPFAGGSSHFFRTWTEPARRLDVEVVPVELPGHGTRLRDPLVTGMAAMVDALCEEVLREERGPYAILGHSMGAKIAYAVAEELERRPGATPPARLFVSGSLPASAAEPKPLHGLPDAALTAELSAMGGTPPEILANAELMEFMLPVIRADLTLLEQWHAPAGSRISCPITAFAGQDDQVVRAELSAGWADHTSASFALRVHPGDHFFLREEMDVMLGRIAAELQAHAVDLPTPGGA